MLEVYIEFGFNDYTIRPLTLVLCQILPLYIADDGLTWAFQMLLTKY